MFKMIGDVIQGKGPGSTPTTPKKGKILEMKNTETQLTNQ